MKTIKMHQYDEITGEWLIFERENATIHSAISHLCGNVEGWNLERDNITAGGDRIITHRSDRGHVSKTVIFAFEN